MQLESAQHFLSFPSFYSDRLQLFGLLTHEDAIANIELANASEQLAQAMKKDSSAMKTVSIMTMAFLPAMLQLFSRSRRCSGTSQGLFKTNFGYIGLSHFQPLLFCLLPGS